MANDSKKMFEVYGPFEVPLEKGYRRVAKDLRTLWEQEGASEVGDRAGVYVLCIKTSRGEMPTYVGKTTKQSFKAEAFTPAKLYLYDKALDDYKIGKPVIYFIAYPIVRGPINAKAIDELETYLINEASRRNPNLTNLRKVKKYNWGICGVLRTGPGKPSASATKFKGALGLK